MAKCIKETAHCREECKLKLNNSSWFKHKKMRRIESVSPTKMFLGLLLLSLLTTTIKAQNLVVSLEAEKAELTLPAKVKRVNGFSGNAYVGDNDAGSAIIFRNVTVEKEGLYEFRTYYTSMVLRSIAIKSGYYSKVISTCPTGTPGWDAPPVANMPAYIYLNQGVNTITVTPYNGGGPNIDKFEIWDTPVVMPRPEPERITFDYDLTDDAVITSNQATGNLDYLTDNDEHTVYTFSASSAEIKIACDMPYILTGYLLSPGAYSLQDTKSWKLESSTDGTNYLVVTPSRVEDLGNGAMYHINRKAHEANKAAQYYRLTAYNGAIGEIQLFGIPYLANTDKKNFPPDITQGPDIQAKAWGNPLGVFTDVFDERYYNLFNRDMALKYYSPDAPNFTVEIELGNPAALDYYTLTSCADYPERDPKSWVVEGFDRDWEAVSEIRGFLFPTRYTTMKFYCEPDKKYRGYRLRTLENNGADSFQLLKWQLFAKPESSGIPENHSQQLMAFSSGREIIIQSEKAGHYWITDVSGQRIAAGQLNAPELSINTDKGIYIVKIVTDNGVLIKKVVVE